MSESGQPPKKRARRDDGGWDGGEGEGELRTSTFSNLFNSDDYGAVLGDSASASSLHKDALRTTTDGYEQLALARSVVGGRAGGGGGVDELNLSTGLSGWDMGRSVLLTSDAGDFHNMYASTDVNYDSYAPTSFAQSGASDIFSSFSASSSAFPASTPFSPFGDHPGYRPPTGSLSADPSHPPPPSSSSHASLAPNPSSAAQFVPRQPPAAPAASSSSTSFRGDVAIHPPSSPPLLLRSAFPPSQLPHGGVERELMAGVSCHPPWLKEYAFLASPEARPRFDGIDQQFKGHVKAKMEELKSRLKVPSPS
jgi:hypothetical protein